VFSACQTEGENEVEDSGAESLAESFLNEGVPHVIATRWNVDSSEAAEFMKQFYSQLLAGKSVSEAMHSEQLAMLRQPASSHPYYWATFKLRGTR
jgi:CHAT domain-containing protein